MAVMATRGDLRRLALDSWLLPTDFQLNVAYYWTAGDAGLAASLTRMRQARRQSDWGESGTRVLPMPLSDRRRGTPVLGAIPNQGTDLWQYHRETLRQFVGLAAGLDRPERKPLRERPLLGVPLLGTGNSTAYLKDHGAHITGLLDELDAQSERYDVDLVVVLKDEAAFSAVQAVRRQRRLLAVGNEPWRQHVDRLGGLARQGQLVLFTGAGTGIPAGLPDWNQLLGDLAAWAEVPEASLPRFNKMAAVDRAAIVAGKTSSERMGDEIAKRMDVPHVSLSHSLLASLPVTENVTLNYDECFENAAADAGAPVSVLPYEPAFGRWLLKLHGCIREGRRRDIVLTRGDYLDLGQHRASLTGLVQALLVTRHMLFVGFGLSDDHFHAVVHDVKRALAGTKRSSLGTVLLLDRDELQEQLWGGDLQYVAMSGEPAAAARELEVFLDQLLMVASTSDRHLFDAHYATLLTPAERRLRDQLTELMDGAELGSNAGARVVELLRTMGWQAGGHQGH